MMNHNARKKSRVEHCVNPPSGDRLKILVCKPRLARQTIRLNRFIGCEPLEMEYLYSALQHHDVQLLDGIVDRRDPVRLAKKYGPQIVLFTSFITTISSVLKIAAQLKALPHPPLTFVGGPHAEVMPEHFYSQYIDGVFFANQLEALNRVIVSIQQNESYHNIPGGAFQIQGQFRRNPSLPLDPASLPQPKHILIRRFPKRYKIIHYKPCAAIKTSFGCPDKCTFCFCTEMHGGTFAVRPIEDVVDEIETIPVKNIIILDDNFLINRKRLLKFCDLIEKRALHKEFIAVGNARFAAQNADIMRRLRQVGVTALMIGFEFVTDELLESVDKKSTIAENNATIEICRELDIDLFAL
ncbi:MAG: radical SAM protein, partial [Calditrichaeota bacterium]